MKTFTRYLVIGSLTAISHVAAQPVREPQNAEYIRQQLEALRSQMDAQAKLMAQLQTRLDEMERARTTATSSATADQQSVVPPTPPSTHVGQATANYQTFSQ